MNFLKIVPVIGQSSINSIIDGFTSSATSTFVAIASGVAVMMFAGLGVWFMVAGQEDTSKIKKWFIRVVCGYIIVITAASIVGYITSQAGGWG
ncbi:hypothetical protein ACTQ54_04995 [Fundicoccus sp. Sow4_H7]|uniref:hypothetical protein n=1 Tax=Fundicoccus sp. Sow4_H7 TaxID=3438784 RepID=UPI003F91D970